MAEITVRRGGEMMRAVFEVLYDAPEGMSSRRIFERVERILPPTDFEKSPYPKQPKVRRYENLIRFQSISSVKAGWLVKNKGQWLLTDDGRKAFDTFKDPEEFQREAIRLYKEWARSQPDAAIGEEESDSIVASATLEEAQTSAREEIENYLHHMPPYDFQKLVGALLEAMGYHVSWSAPPGPDRGIDLIATLDPLGVSGPRIKVQVKRRDDKTSAEELRAFMAVLGEQDVGIFVSLSGFTPNAQMEARTQERRKMTLVDVNMLFDLWVEHFSKIPDAERQLLPIKPVYFLDPRT